MAASYLLDTNVYCQPIKPEPLVSVMRRLENAGDRCVSISVISELEILFGIRREKALRQQDSYENLLKDRYPIFDIDRDVTAMAVEIKLHLEFKGKPISPFDLLIAATAKSHNLILATLNVRHFSNIEGLAVEDWSK